MSAKGGSVMGNADHQSSAIFRNTVNPIRDSDSDGIGAEVVIIDAARSRFPTLTRIFELKFPTVPRTQGRDRRHPTTPSLLGLPPKRSADCFDVRRRPCR